jgi:hypothetical protein
VWFQALDGPELRVLTSKSILIHDVTTVTLQTTKNEVRYNPMSELNQKMPDRNINPYNQKMVVSVGDKFYDRTGQSDFTYVVVSEYPIKGKFPVKILDADGNEYSYSSADITDSRIFNLRVNRPYLPPIVETKVYLYADGHLSLAPTSEGEDFVAQHDISEGTWRYSDNEIISQDTW